MWMGRWTKIEILIFFADPFLIAVKNVH